MVTLLGAANRNPDTYADSDRFDITCTGPSPLTFGTGIHYCIQQITLRKADWKRAIVLRGFDMLELGFSSSRLMALG